MPAQPRSDWLDWAVDRAARGVFWASFRLPYRKRVALVGRVMRAVGGVAGYRARAEEHLAYIFPDMPKAERNRIAVQVLDNIGRTLIENYSAPDLLHHAQDWQPEGPGWAACEAARAERRPMLFVSGHFGNYQAARAAMNVRGYDMGALHRPMNNPYFEEHYQQAVESIGGRAFARDRRGLAAFARELREGGQAAMLIDQYFADGERLDFMGQLAPTVLSAGKIALKQDALLVPIYAKRLQNGIDFKVTVEAPIPHSTPRDMTQALNDSLSAQVRAAPEQWLWVHRRWKPGRQQAYFPPLDHDDIAEQDGG